MQTERLEGCLASEVKSTFRGPGLSAQHPHQRSHPYITPVPRDQMPSSDLYGYQAHHVIDIHRGKTFTHIK